MLSTTTTVNTCSLLMWLVTPILNWNGWGVNEPLDSTWASFSPVTFTRSLRPGAGIAATIPLPRTVLVTATDGGLRTTTDDGLGTTTDGGLGTATDGGLGLNSVAASGTARATCCSHPSQRCERIISRYACTNNTMEIIIIHEYIYYTLTTRIISRSKTDQAMAWPAGVWYGHDHLDIRSAWKLLGS